MRSRMLAGLVMLATAATVRAQVNGNLSAFDIPIRRCIECDDPPTILPPLLSVPPGTAPQPKGPCGPSGEYDPGYFYLPERAPDRAGPGPCGPAGRFWISPNLELAWLKPVQAPALVRLGGLSGPVAYGGQQSTPFTAGFSLSNGLWLNEGRTMGIDAGVLLLPQTGTNTVFFSNGASLLLPTPLGPFPLADPVLGYAGAYQAGFNTRFTSADVNYRNNLFCTEDARVDALVGYRFAHVGDEGAIYGKRLGPGGEIVRFRDDIIADNNFHGGQIGLAGEYRVDRWFISGTGKVAFGAVLSDTDLEGKLRVNGTVVPIGFYARPGLNGPRDHSSVAVMPVAGLTFGRQLGDHTRAYLGYNFLYLSHLTRATDVIDPTPAVMASNPQAPQAASVLRRDAATSDFWVQTLSFGVEWRY